jgi:hypothetical protein
MTRVQRLAALADLLRDRDLVRVQRAASACRTSETRISALAQPVPLAGDPALMAARQAHVAWAREQRARLSQSLALQHAALSDARAHAARSFARAQVLQKLAQVRR